MAFTTIYDISLQGYSTWWFPAVGLIGVVVGVMTVLDVPVVRFIMPKRYYGKGRTAMGWFLIAFSAFWVAATFIETYTDYLGAVRCLSLGSCPTVEGPVTDFVTTPKKESFTVAGRRFSYSNFTVTPGFRHTASQGGPIREGLHLRITYSGSDILKVETAQ